LDAGRESLCLRSGPVHAAGQATGPVCRGLQTLHQRGGSCDSLSETAADPAGAVPHATQSAFQGREALTARGDLAGEIPEDRCALEQRRRSEYCVHTGLAGNPLLEAFQNAQALGGGDRPLCSKVDLEGGGPTRAAVTLDGLV